jgi:HK97 family phage major capsid protein
MSEFDNTDTGATQDAAGMLKRFVQDFSGFQERIDAKLRTQDDRLSKLDQKAATVSRPALGGGPAGDGVYRKALSDFLRKGETAALEGGFDRKALITTDPAHGGILVSASANDTISTLNRSAGTLRAIANVVQVEGSVYEAILESADAQTAWITESSALSETAASSLDRVTIPLNELAAMPRVSQRLLEDSAFDVETWLATSVAQTFARAEGDAFINGDGAGTMPHGILRYATNPVGATAANEIGYVATGVAGGFNSTDPADDIIDLVYSVDARFRCNGAFVMNSTTAGSIRKLKDVDGRFLWTDQMCEGQPARLFGYPVVICENMPSISADAFAVAFGDFQAGYTIAERPDLRILRDPYSAKPHVQFFVSSRVGGAVVDFDAIRLLKFGVS